MFVNRQQAGSLLASEINEFFRANTQLNKEQTIVLALPRGGVTVALEIALAIECPLDIIASKKIGAPGQPELAVGAVTSDGIVVVDHALKYFLNISDVQLEIEKQQLISKIQKSEEDWHRAAGMDVPLDLYGKSVIVVDDGVATGMTAIAAARSVRSCGTAHLIFATPVVSRHAYELLQEEYDRVIALEVPLDFRSVGRFYTDFNQVSDDSVTEALTVVKRKIMLK